MPRKKKEPIVHRETPDVACRVCRENGVIKIIKREQTLYHAAHAHPHELQDYLPPLTAKDMPALQGYAMRKKS